MASKLTKKQITEAVQQYARRHGYYTHTVRVVSSLFYAALAEYQSHAN